MFAIIAALVVGVVVGYILAAFFIGADPDPVPSFSVIIRDTFGRQMFGVNSEEVHGIIIRHGEDNSVGFPILTDTMELQVILTDTSEELLR